MELINRTALVAAVRRHRDAADWLARWIAVVEAARWTTLNDVRELYQATDGVRLKSRVIVTVFNVMGNKYRLLTHIDYVGQRVYVIELLTHAEYSKNRWKGRL